MFRTSSALSARARPCDFGNAAAVAFREVLAYPPSVSVLPAATLADSGLDRDLMDFSHYCARFESRVELIVVNDTDRPLTLVS